MYWEHSDLGATGEGSEAEIPLKSVPIPIVVNYAHLDWGSSLLMVVGKAGKVRQLE